MIGVIALGFDRAGEKRLLGVLAVPDVLRRVAPNRDAWVAPPSIMGTASSVPSESMVVLNLERGSLARGVRGLRCLVIASCLDDSDLLTSALELCDEAIGPDRVGVLLVGSEAAALGGLAELSRHRWTHVGWGSSS